MVFFSFGALAGSQKTCCVCETGTFPSKETGFFYQGCRFWLDDQKNCTTRQIVPKGYQYENLACTEGLLKIGYVGHWSGSIETVRYIEQVLVPLMNQNNVDIFVDNTACLALQESSRVQAHMVDLSKGSRMPAGKNLTIRGNQVSSVGIWEKLMGPSYNFGALVSTQFLEARLPKCEQFEGRSCLATVQHGEEAHCISKNKTKKTLQCCKPLSEDSGEGHSFENPHVWSESCL